MNISIKFLVFFGLWHGVSGFASSRPLELDLQTGRVIPMSDNTQSILQLFRDTQPDIACNLSPEQIEVARGVVDDALSYINAVKSELHESVAKSEKFQVAARKNKLFPRDLVLDSLVQGMLSNLKLFVDNLVFLRNAIHYDLQSQTSSADRNYAFNKLRREVASINQWFGSDPGFIALVGSISDLDYLGTLKGIFTELANFFPSSNAGLPGGVFELANGKTRVDDMDALNKKKFTAATPVDNFDCKRCKARLKERFPGNLPLRKAIFSEVRSRKRVQFAEHQHAMVERYLESNDPDIAYLCNPLTRSGNRLYENEMKILQRLRAHEERMVQRKAMQEAKSVLAIIAPHAPIVGNFNNNDDDDDPTTEQSRESEAAILHVLHSANTDAVDVDEETFDPSTNHAAHQLRKQQIAASISAQSSTPQTSSEIIMLLRNAIYSNQETVNWREFARIIEANGYRIDSKNGSVRHIVDLATAKKFTVHKPSDESQPFLQLGEYRSFIASGFSRIFGLTAEYVKNIMAEEIINPSFT